MSIEINAGGDWVRLLPGATTPRELPADSFAITAKVKRLADRNAYTPILATYDDVSGISGIAAIADGDTLRVQREYGDASATAVGVIGTGNWESVAFVGANVGGVTKWRGYHRSSGGTTSSVEANGSGTGIKDLLLGTSYGASFFDGRFADVKIWRRTLSAAEIEAEFNSKTAVLTTDLLCVNSFDGTDLASALTSDVSNDTWTGTWLTSGAPTFSADAPSYAAPSPSLSGEDTLPSLEAAPVAGSLSATLAGATLTSAGGVLVKGSAIATLAGASLSSAGRVSVAGSVSASLAGPTLASAARVAVSGSVSATLSGATLSAGTSVTTSGSLSITLDGVTSASVGSVRIGGAVNASLAGVSLSSSDVRSTRGYVDQTLAGATLSSTSSAIIVGGAGLSLDGASLTAAGTVPISGSASIVLSSDSLSSDGIRIDQVIKAVGLNQPVIATLFVKEAFLTVTSGEALMNVTAQDIRLDL